MHVCKSTLILHKPTDPRTTRRCVSVSEHLLLYQIKLFFLIQRFPLKLFVKAVNVNNANQNWIWDYATTYMCIDFSARSLLLLLPVQYNEKYVCNVPWLHLIPISGTNRWPCLCNNSREIFHQILQSVVPNIVNFFALPKELFQSARQA